MSRVHLKVQNRTACEFLLGFQDGPGRKVLDPAKVTCPSCLVQMDLWAALGWNKRGEWGPKDPGSDPPAPFVYEVRKIPEFVKAEISDTSEMVEERYWVEDTGGPPYFNLATAIEDGFPIPLLEAERLLFSGIDRDPRYRRWIRQEAVAYIEERLDETGFYSPAEKRLLRQTIRQMREDGLA